MDISTAAEASVWPAVWAFAQQVATFAVALIAIWAAVVRPWLAKKDAERKTETQERERARRREIVDEVEKVVAPVRQQVEAIHKTTHINGGKNSPPTLRDEVNNVGKQVETAIRAVGAVAVNQAKLSADFQEHLDGSDRYVRQVRATFAEHGIELPEVPRPPLRGDESQADI